MVIDKDTTCSYVKINRANFLYITNLMNASTAGDPIRLRNQEYNNISIEEISNIVFPRFNNKFDNYSGYMVAGADIDMDIESLGKINMRYSVNANYIRINNDARRFMYESLTNFSMLLEGEDLDTIETKSKEYFSNSDHHRGIKMKLTYRRE
jgi:hypothetical protein